MALSKLLQTFIAEFIGTAFLICTIKIASAYADGFAPIAIGFSLVVTIFAYGYISGAHFNPCVTTGVLIRSYKSTKDIIEFSVYYLAEFTGGIFGGFMAWLAGGNKAGIVYPQCVNKDHARQCFCGELFYTFLLVTVVLHVATDKRQANNSFYGLAIGGTVMLGAFSMGAVSGGCFNTAVYVGTIITARFVASNTGSKYTMTHVHTWWIYILAPLMGGVIAGLLYRFVFHSSAADDKPKYSNRQPLNDNSRIGGEDTYN